MVPVVIIVVSVRVSTVAGESGGLLTWLDGEGPKRELKSGEKCLCTEGGRGGVVLFLCCSVLYSTPSESLLLSPEVHSAHPSIAWLWLARYFSYSLDALCICLHWLFICEFLYLYIYIILTKIVYVISFSICILL